jgi:hypothetical protein
MTLQPYLRTLAVYTVGRTPWMRISPSQDHNPHTIHRLNTHIDISAFKKGKTLHALDCAGTVIGIIIVT